MTHYLIREVILSWLKEQTHQYADDLFGDGEAVVIDGTFNVDELAKRIASTCPLSDAEVVG